MEGNSQPNQQGPQDKPDHSLALRIITLITAVGGVGFLSLSGPPSDAPGIVQFAAVCMAAASWFLGLFLAEQWSKNSSPEEARKRQAEVALVCLIGCLFVGVSYYLRWNAWTARYYKRRVWTGDMRYLTPQGRLYLKRHPTASKEQLIIDDQGKVTEIWDYEKGIKPRLWRLWAWFLILISLGVLTLKFAERALRSFTQGRD
jgi:hypothetical protein